MQSASEGSMSAARALRNVLVHLSPEVAAQTLIEQFPWVDVLAGDDQAQFVTDFWAPYLLPPKTDMAAKRGDRVVSLDDYRPLKETVYLLGSPENARRLITAIERLETGTARTRRLKPVWGQYVDRVFRVSRARPGEAISLRRGGRPSAEAAGQGWNRRV